MRSDSQVEPAGAREAGFTLIELTVVVGVMVILAAAAFAFGRGRMAQARLERTGAELEGLVEIAALHFERQGQVDLTDSVIVGVRRVLGVDDLTLGDVTLNLGNAADLATLGNLAPAQISSVFGTNYSLIFRRRAVAAQVCVPDPNNILTPVALGPVDATITVDWNPAGCAADESLVVAGRIYPPGRMPGLMMGKRHLHDGQ